MATDEGSDVVANQSSFLCRYMNNHSDTLLAYIAAHTGETGARECKMTGITTKNMSLSFTVPAQGSHTQHVNIPFDPPLAAFDEVRPRLVQMKHDSEEKVGMAKAPEVKQYSINTGAVITTAALGLLCFSSLSPHSTLLSDEWLGLAATIRKYVGGWLIIRISWGIVIVFHSLEATYHAYLLSQHTVSWSLKLLWTVSTLFFGIPSILEYRRLVKKSRIESIKKSS